MGQSCLSKGFLFLPQVYKNLQLFVENKEPGDELFDRLTVSPGASGQC